MTAELIFAPEVEGDIAEAYAWYEQQRFGLGEDFLGAVDACISAIGRSPTIAQRILGNYRRTLVRRFPYAVFYEFQDKTVTIYGVFHTSRDPNKWRQRLS